MKPTYSQLVACVDQLRSELDEATTPVLQEELVDLFRHFMGEEAACVLEATMRASGYVVTRQGTADDR